VNSLKKFIYQIIYLTKYRSNRIGKNVRIDVKASALNNIIRDNARVAAYADVRYSTIGEYSSIGRSSKLTYCTVGRFSSISWDCTINAVSHPYTSLTNHAFPYVPYIGGFVTTRTQKNVFSIIENDVWVGANSVILPGVTIHNGAIVGAGSVVTKDVPPYAIAVGSPAKVIKYRFSQEIIDELLEIKWWNLSKEVLKNNIELFQGDFNKEKLITLKKLCLS
jgi:acetyltransferase-like isoleucine patch superfamily enzyme